MTNQEILRKADMALADLASGGLLNPAQAAKFIRKMIEPSVLLQRIRTVEMNEPVRNINKIGFGSRILRAGVSATPLVGTYTAATPGTGRSKPTTEQVQLVTKEMLAEVVLPYDVLEDNIEGGNVAAGGPTGPDGPQAGGLQATLIDLIAERCGTDLEEYCLLADTAKVGVDAFLAQTDGFIKLAEESGHVVDNGGTPAYIDKGLFKKGLFAMPDKYLRLRPQMRHFVSVDNEIEYRDSLAGRETPMGDNQITNGGPLFAYGVPVEPVPLMPTAKGLFCDPMNLIMGVQRKVTFEYDKDIGARTFRIVVSLRVALEIEEADAVVVYNEIKDPTE